MFTTHALLVTSAGLAAALLSSSPAAAGLIGASEDSALRGTWSYDFEAGAEVTVTPESDMWWEQLTWTERRMAIYWQLPAGGLYAFGDTVAFEDLTEADLVALPYSRDPIPGGDAVNLLTPGDVFAVLTQEGNFAKVQVIEYGLQNRMFFRYELYDGAPVGPVCPDFDDDGAVNFGDLNTLLAAWDTEVPPGTEGDVTGNGLVNFEDLNALLAAWGNECE